MLAAEDPLQSQSKRNEVSVPIYSNDIQFTVQSNTFYVYLKCSTDIDSYVNLSCPTHYRENHLFSKYQTKSHHEKNFGSHLALDHFPNEKY